MIHYKWNNEESTLVKRMKKAIVIPILKPGKNDTFPENYKPICLLPMLNNIAEELLAIRFKRILKKSKIDDTNQFGYKK